jgi:hypothetical protein
MGKCGLLIGVVALVVGIGCAERQTDPRIEAHGGEWLEIGSPDFHGDRVRAQSAQSCTTCHGENFRGQPHEPGCYECHDGAGGHPEGFAVIGSDVFHGQDVRAFGAIPCADCHGEDYEGDWTGVSCFTCHAGGPSGHPSGYVTVGSPVFHGRNVEATGPSPCQDCHGEDYRGDWTGVSCFTCHAGGPSGHPRGWLDDSAPTFHGDRVVQEGPEDCWRCHGDGGSGGTSGVACSDCH